MSRDASWRFPLLLLVIGAHLWLGWKLAHYRPAGLRSPTAARAGGTEPEVLMVLDFSVRAPATRASKRRAGKGPPAQRQRDTAEGLAADAAAAGVASDQAEAPRTLELQLRPTGQPDFRAPDPLRHRAALAFESTRFEQAWQGDGNLTQLVARKSVVAGIVLGALGALRQPCTDQQRRLNDPKCVPDQYRYPGPGE